MDFLRFVDSRAVRDYWKKIGYTCDSLQTAWLISVCGTLTMRQRHDAWQELIETMPDCPLKERMNVVPRESLHQVLREIMAIDQRNLDDFCRNEPLAVYQYETYSREDGHEESDILFSSYEHCLFAVKTELQKYPEISSVSVTKRYCDREEPWYVLNLTRDLEPKWLNRYPCRDEAEENTTHYALEGLWFPFPLPFERGDVVCYSQDGDPYVLVQAGFEDVSEWCRENGDESDMTLTAQGAGDNGGFCHDHLLFWALEYYEKPLTGENRTLQALQYFYKGKLEAPEFAELYHNICMEERARRSGREAARMLELIEKQEARSAETKPASDPFYSESNIHYLENVVRDIKAGKAHFSEHELLEEDE